MAVFYNQAQLSYNNTVTNSNLVVGELLSALSAAKKALIETYEEGGTVTYMISIVNNDTTAYTGLTITDNLGAYTFGSQTLVPLTYVSGSVQYYSNGVLQAAPATTLTPSLVISGISVPAGGNAVIIYQTTLNSYAPLGTNQSITNTATITGSDISPLPVTETVTNATDPVLTINKAVNPVPVSENGTLTYTFTIQNYGATELTSQANASITDLFDPALSGLNVSFNNTTWVSPTNYTYGTPANTFITQPGQITVPAATYVQDATTGAWSVEPGVSTLIVSGTIA